MILKMLQQHKKILLIWLCCLLSVAFHTAYAQNNVGIGTNQPNPNAVLELVAPNANQGFLIPSLTTLQRTAGAFTGNLSVDDNGLMVFDLDEKVFYYWNDSIWMSMVGNTEAGGDLTGTYPDPAIRDGAIITEKLADGAVTSDKIADRTIKEEDLYSPGPGKVLTTTGSGQVFWDNQSLFGVAFLEQGRVYIGNSSNRPEAVDLGGEGQILVGNGTSAAAVRVHGDITLNSSGNTQIVAGAVGTEEVQDNSLSNVDINANAAIVGTKIIPEFGDQRISTTGNLAVQNINAGGNLSVAGKVVSASTENTDGATTLTTKDYVDAGIVAASQNLEASSGIAEIIYNGTEVATVAVKNGAGLNFDNTGALQIADDGVTAVKINPDVAGDGLGQALNGALTLDINGIGAIDVISDSDEIAVYDASAQQLAKVSRANLIEGAPISNINVDGGSVDNTPIGATTPAAGAFTSISGDGSAIANLNADNITSGTLADAYLPNSGPGAQTFGGNGEVIESIEIDAKGRVVNVVAGASASDVRLKKDIEPLQSALSQVLQLRGYHYYWKDQSRDSTLQIGVIAQELEKVYPELVRERSDHYKGVNYTGLIPVLIEAIKEQQQTIESLQQQLNHGRTTVGTIPELQQMENLRQENKVMKAELEMIKSALGLQEEVKSPAVNQPE